MNTYDICPNYGCGCDRRDPVFAAVWIEHGKPAHLHADGSLGFGGPNGVTDGKAQILAEAQIANAGWVERGWVAYDYTRWIPSSWR